MGLRQARSGLSLLELLIVIAIIAVLLSLLFPAIQYSRRMSRRVQCQGHLHQLGVAMTHFVEARRELPDPAAEGRIGGWAIDILPFMEEGVLADRLSGEPPLDSASHQRLAHDRPTIMSCPSRDDPPHLAYEPSHYKASFQRQGRWKNHWSISEVRLDVQVPWVASLENDYRDTPPTWPHGGYHKIRGRGSQAGAVYYVDP